MIGLTKALLAATAFSVVALLFGLVLLMPTIAGTNAAGTEAALGILAIDPSDDALRDIPPLLLPVYVQAAEACPGLPWTVIAGIGKVESNHGRYRGAAIAPNGRVTPPIIGIPLNGAPGTAAIRDTDNGQLDNDPVWDRAIGPFQFIPSSWAIFGVDGNRDGTADPQNVYDAVPTAVKHLCPDGQLTDIDAAIFSYNHSTAYVQLVLQWADTYTGAVSAIPIAAGYAPPLNGLSLAQATHSHHDYPAIDVGLSSGTPTFAMVEGTVAVAFKSIAVFDGSTGRCGSTVTIEGVDGVRYTYCHLSEVEVTSGQTVVAGQRIGLTGGQPGTSGAGNTTGPHLHLAMSGGGRALCPQPVILSILLGAPINPLAAPSSGCISGQPTKGWVLWLDRLTPQALPRPATTTT
ncbi:MAG: peptidoglycan DD-metalloendopeptidase family protein [Actinomycetia bacterium]|nr:peptidoglycan DD-metalloendopeptidase family protein [Actinomycetes bacterium]